MEKLEKSVEPAAARVSTIEKICPWAFAAAIMLGLTTTAFVREASISKNRADNFEARTAERGRENEDLRSELNSLRNDVFELTDAADPEYLLETETDTARQYLIACVKNPDGLIFAAEAVGLKWSSVFRFDNPESIVNDDGKRFFPGQTCKIGFDKGFVIRRDGEVYEVYTVTMTVGTSLAGECPRGAYRLVSRDNQILRKAVYHGCLKKAKAIELGLSAP